MAGSYNGSPWRSRFLRSPKVGLELAGRSDFVPVAEVANVKLGMKTGNDKFFYVTAVHPPKGSKVHVRGMARWEAEVSLHDLVPAVTTPKNLDTAAGRVATVPTRRGRYSGEHYYFSPRPHLNRVTREYIELGELHEVEKGKLVRENAGGGDWYRPVRGRIQSRWILPYSSGYDYGAVDNTVGALLNGRCVGVEPLAGVDSDLLGAILNSTMVTLMRLLEGVATGSEGAFDVGPPAVRVIKIPDPRLFNDHARQRVLDVVDRIQFEGILPPAPDRHGNVTDVRRYLDLAVLGGLGMSDGDAAVLANRIYASYGRWRDAVEKVEAQTQNHRRQLVQRGGNRQESPSRRATRTVWNEVAALVPDLFAGLLSFGTHELVDPIFQDDDQNQARLFSQYTYDSSDGTHVDLKDPMRVALAKRVRAFGFTGPIPLPLDPEACRTVSEQIVTTEAITVADIERRANLHVSADLAPEVSAAVRNKWISRSIASLREALNVVEDVEAAVEPDLFDTYGMVPPTVETRTRR